MFENRRSYVDGFKRNSNGHVAHLYYDFYEADEYKIMRTILNLQVCSI